MCHSIIRLYYTYTYIHIIVFFITDMGDGSQIVLYMRVNIQFTQIFFQELEKKIPDLHRKLLSANTHLSWSGGQYFVKTHLVSPAASWAPYLSGFVKLTGASSGTCKAPVLQGALQCCCGLHTHIHTHICTFPFPTDVEVVFLKDSSSFTTTPGIGFYEASKRVDWWSLMQSGLGKAPRNFVKLLLR